MHPERELTALQHCVVEELNLFVNDATRSFLYIVVPDRHTCGRSYAVTEWLSRCTLQQCAHITVFTGSALQAKDLLQRTHDKMRDRTLIRHDARSLLYLQDTPGMRFLCTYGGKMWRGLGIAGNTLHINMHSVLATLSDEQIVRFWLQINVKQVWMVRTSDFERLRCLYEDHKAGEIAQLGRDLQRLHR